MGVPSFYRWLVKKYPKIESEALEDQTGSANPNGVEFDNFYIDMNGIIHACFHPEDDPFPPTTFDDVFGSIYEYIDRLVLIVRPRKLLYMAIDGVAPRAKMNQQRARRFRTSKDIRMAEEIEEKLRKQFEREGKALLPKQESQVTDSNVITPGTEFMHMLSKKLQSYIRLRMSENPAWGNIKVILSDDNVPGEGEHKIMSFIRAQRASLGYDPNTKHCLYGLDADLIMLALATHEIHFSILREEVLCPKNPLNLASALEHGQHKGKSEILVSCKEAAWNVNKKQHYLFLNMWVLREYLALDFRVSFAENGEEKYDLERIIDDFIFICFFSGNDFLPHIPSLQIHEACMDLLMYVYKKEFEKLGGYLVDMQRVRVHDKNGTYIKLKRVERFILLVGEYEDKIFLKRSELRERKLKRILSEHREAKDYEKDELDEGRSSDVLLSSAINDDEEINITASTVDDDAVYVNMKELQVELKHRINNQSDLFKDGVGTDSVKFGKHGWKERYYRVKFSAQTPEEAETIRKSVVAKYTEGLCWVLLYYFSGVPSWTWYYPYHYGPLASDCKGLSATKVKFQKGLPFKPFDQLMGVLPPMSARALPVAYQGLMIDENSSIIDFFPTEFETDMDGKRYMWQGICKLPFIDEERLLRETRKLENELKDNEKTRNLETLSQLFLGHWQQFELGSRAREASEKIKGAVKIDSPIEDVKGVLHMMLEELVESENDYKDKCARNVLHMFYEICQDFQHIPRLPERVIIPDEIVHEEDIEETILWHESRGSSSWSNRFRPQRPTKLMHNLESRSPISYAAVEVEGSGSGFTLGRGKTSNERAKETFHCHNMQPNSLWDHRASGCQPFVLKSAHNGRSNVGMWKREFCGRMEGLQISEPNHYPMPYNKPMQVNSNFWPLPRGVTKDGRWHNLRDASGSSLQRNDVERAGLAQLPNQPFSGNGGRQMDCNFWLSPSGVTEDWRRPPSQPFSACRGRQVDCNFLPSPRGATADWRRPPSQPFSACRGRQVDCNVLPSPRGATGDWRWHKVGDASGGGVQGNFIGRAGPAQLSANRGRGGRGRGSGSYVNKNAGTNWNS